MKHTQLNTAHYTYTTKYSSLYLHN